MLPSILLELVIGPQPEALELGGQEARNRFNYVFQSFVKVIARQEHQSPEAGDLIQHTGGLRKLRWQDPRRGKGKRGG
jgi:hypothetical protein